METNARQNLYIQYLQSEQQVLDAWFNLKSLYSKLATAHDAMCQKFFEKPELKKFGHTQRYCIMKQYKPVMSDVFNVLNRDFPAGREFSEPLFWLLFASLHRNKNILENLSEKNKHILLRFRKNQIVRIYPA